MSTPTRSRKSARLNPRTPTKESTTKVRRKPATIPLACETRYQFSLRDQSIGGQMIDENGNGVNLVISPRNCRSRGSKERLSKIIAESELPKSRKNKKVEQEKKVNIKPSKFSPARVLRSHQPMRTGQTSRPRNQAQIYIESNSGRWEEGEENLRYEKQEHLQRGLHSIVEQEQEQIATTQFSPEVHNEGRMEMEIQPVLTLSEILAQSVQPPNLQMGHIQTSPSSHQFQACYMMEEEDISCYLNF